MLAEFYEEVVNASSSDLAIVFVSSDSDEESFAEYYGSMPWYSVPYSERDLAQSLGKLTSRIKQPTNLPCNLLD